MLGVILSGGTGSRLRPFTLVSNKHLAPLYTKDGAIPMIHFPIKTLRESGITEILIISSREHSGDIIQHLGDGKDYNVNLTYKIQEMNRFPTGIAQALKLAEHFVGNNNFAVILGDNYYENTFKKEFEDFDKKYNNKDNKKYGASIFLKQVHDPHRFGVATFNQNTNNISVTKIVEKPSNPESNFAVTGLYLYTPHVFSILPNLSPSNRGEIEITDVNNHYVSIDKMDAYVLNDFWHDMGTVESMIHTHKFINKL